MRIEFGGKDFVERSAKDIKKLKPVFDELDTLQKKLLEQNAEKTELLRRALELHNAIERFSMSDFFSSNYKETPKAKVLKELSKKCYSVKSQAELDAIITKFQEITGKSYDRALNQTGINASSGILKTAVPCVHDAVNSASENLPSGSVQPIIQQQKTSVSSTIPSVVQKTFDNGEIMAEAKKRTAAEKMAAETAAKAQKYYSSLSDVTTGKSAKESAEVIEASLKAAEEYKKQIVQEALKRTKAAETAKQRAEQAQQYYKALTDSVTGKSAKESAGIIEASIKAAEKQRKEAYSRVLPPKTEKSFNHAAEIVKVSKDNIVKRQRKDTKNNADKFKIFIKEKIAPFTKKKQFKFIIAVISALTAVIISAGIIKHNSNKQTKGLEIYK